MDLTRMLDKCQAGQWSVDDLDWSHPPPTLSPHDEEAIVQYFTDMAGIETLAGALFKVQSEKVADPTLRAILRTFVADEMRHAAAARRLAAHYNVRNLRTYRRNPHLDRFAARFIRVIRGLPPDISMTYILGGELILDIALLRSLTDYVNDEMAAQVMQRINRDESRHIAIDYHMVEFFTSDAYAAERREARKRRRPADMLRGAAQLVHLFYLGAPFFRTVFFEPMRLTDPSGARIREAFKRIQLLGAKEEIYRRPFARFLDRLFRIFNHPIGGALLGPIVLRIIGIEPQLLKTLYTEAEERRARGMSFDELAADALQAKLSPA